MMFFLRQVRAVHLIMHVIIFSILPVDPAVTTARHSLCRYVNGFNKSIVTKQSEGMEL